MQIIPAIDILDGKCVRLKQGRYDAETVYSNDPLAMARKWEKEGSQRIHVVDLDGARTGIPKNIEIIKKIKREVEIPIQAGGGIRNYELIQELISFGIDRIILGTTAVKNPNLLEEVCREFGEHIAVAIDTSGSQAATEGWTQVSKKDVLTLAREAISLGVTRFIYTDISRDGMLKGPNFEGIRNFASQVSVPVIAGGGISSKEDIEKLKSLNLEACIVGKALYTGAVALKDVI